MKAGKMKRLKAAGWIPGTVKEFLRLTDDESALVELKLALVAAVRLARRKRGLSQTALAQRSR